MREPLRDKSRLLHIQDAIKTILERAEGLTFEDLTKDKFWGTSFCAAKRYLRTNEVPTFESVRYSYPIFEDDVDESKPRPKIELRVRFENPRIDIRFPDGGFIGLEYKPDTHEFSEAQIFGEDGYWKLPYVKERIDQLINSL